MYPFEANMKTLHCEVLLFLLPLHLAMLFLPRLHLPSYIPPYSILSLLLFSFFQANICFLSFHPLVVPAFLMSASVGMYVAFLLRSSLHVFSDLYALTSKSWLPFLRSLLFLRKQPASPLFSRFLLRFGSVYFPVNLFFY